MAEEEPEASQMAEEAMPQTEGATPQKVADLSGSPRSGSRSPRSPPAGRKRAAVVFLDSLVAAAKRTALWQRDIEDLEKNAGSFLELGLSMAEIQRGVDALGPNVELTTTRRAFLAAGLKASLAQVEELKGDIVKLIHTL